MVGGRQIQAKERSMKEGLGGWRGKVALKDEFPVSQLPLSVEVGMRGLATLLGMPQLSPPSVCEVSRIEATPVSKGNSGGQVSNERLSIPELSILP
ncbi:hypothetical protein Nepgr_030905 [Nepenthes gracilis]|uniref:Uncharacterized protein n=1 Tax=Nepenthes gracilis TaxID=150966 RepID=A0AAD3TGM5_NEPGR|nr:hypothetical protein Nepgr_030905 [Nepenthes gracilis]